jgi:hypothetical protein
MELQGIQGGAKFFPLGARLGVLGVLAVNPLSFFICWIREI